MKAYWISLAILLALIFTSCTPIQSASGASAESTPTNGQSQAGAGQAHGDPVIPINTPDFSGLTPPPADANPFVRLVEEDLASRLTINTDQIHFLKISDIDWQDITQGCTATPGQTLTKGRVSGYRIWLEANGKNYLYHVALDNTIFLCPD